MLVGSKSGISSVSSVSRGTCFDWLSHQGPPISRIQYIASSGVHYGQNSFKYLQNISPIIPWLSFVISIILEGRFVFWVMHFICSYLTLACYSNGFTCRSAGWSAMWLCKIGHFHSCCPSPVLNILLEIPWKIEYFINHVCIILGILHAFKISYELRNIEQCYLPWANVICLGKWQITCTATKNRSLLLPALFLYSSSHNWVRKCLGLY